MDLVPTKNPEEFKLRLKLCRWAPDNLEILALQFNTNISGYDNSLFFRIMKSKLWTLGNYHEINGILIPPDTFQNVVTNQYALRYKLGIPMAIKKKVFDTISKIVDSKGECDITLKVFNRTRLFTPPKPVYTTALFNEWRHPRKIYMEFPFSTNSLYWQGVDQFRNELFNNFGFTNLNSFYSYYENCYPNSLLQFLKFGIPKNLRKCDIIVVYVSGKSYFYNNTKIINGDKDIDIQQAILDASKLLNGANMTIIYDSWENDFANAPVNTTIDSIINTRDIPNYPKEVKIIYGSSQGFSNDSPLYKGSEYFKSSWFLYAFLNTIKNSDTNITYRELLEGIKNNYNTISLDNVLDLPEADKECVDLLKNIEPMCGLADISCLDNTIFKNPGFTPKPQVGPIKKALLVGVDCWTNGQARHVNNGYIYAPQLNAPRNDTYLMYKILTEKMGFLPENIVILRNQPNKQLVTQGIDWLMSDNIDGNTLFFYFSGHGSQIQDNNGDEVDNQDEFICLQNATYLEILTDDEIYDLLLKRNTKNCKLWCLFDSCHSGTMGDTSFRFTSDFVDKSNSQPVITKYTSDTKRVDSSPPQNVFMLGATSDLTTTYEFNPKSYKMKYPDPPKGFEWEYNANPPFSCLGYFLWSILEERYWAPIKINDLLIELKKKYKLVSVQSSCIPTLGCNKEYTDNEYFLIG